ncbi:putative leucine rich protein [Operophtera brumata]|uniref:Putative leucine rich protein n=1 Tax=Operophtera brumata TaxID=104452 RepID=A0A0L7LCV1_OPEBR|nr:putative leucine rich protein [Operophtera brumata]
MKSLKLEHSIDTYTAKVRSLIWNKQNSFIVEEMDRAVKNGFQFGETHVMEIVKTLANMGFYETLKSPSISPYMQSVTTSLVFQNHPIAALEIYKCLPLPSFGPKDDQGLHGRSLVRDCVKASMIYKSFGPKDDQGLHGRSLVRDCVKASMPDYETIMNYTLPYVSFTSPQNLMKKFTDTGLTVTSVLTPMMETLLNTGQVRAASYLISSDVKSTVFALEELADKATDKNKDWVGRFLCVFMQNRRISTAATDYCMSRLPEKYSQDTKDAFQKVLISVTDERLVDDADLFTQQMPHPVSIITDFCMSRLPEKYSQVTKDAFQEVLISVTDERLVDDADLFTQQMPHPVFLSAGMKAAIFDLHVKLGELDLAEEALADLNKSAPNFTLDEFKVIDFAALMAYRKQFDKAFNLINEQSMKSRLAAKFNKTPLKHELLCKILQSMSDGQTEDNFLSNEKANGRLNKMAQTLTLVAALADVGYKKTLRKLFLDPTVKFHPDALLRRCERFSTEKKVAALEAIAQCVRGCRRLDESRVYELILDVHQRDDNYKEALALWTRIQEAEDVTPSQKFVNNLVSLLKANNREVPAELSMLLNKHVVVRN